MAIFRQQTALRLALILLALSAGVSFGTASAVPPGSPPIAAAESVAGTAPNPEPNTVPDTTSQSGSDIAETFVAELNINGNITPDFLDIALVHGSLFVSAAALFTAADATGEQPDNQQLNLLLANTGEALEANLDKQTLRINGASATFSAQEFFTAQDTIYIAATLLEKAFNLNIQFDQTTQRLAIETARPWPIDLRVARENRWRTPVQKEQSSALAPITVDFPYQFFGTPEADVSLSAERNNRGQYNGSYNMLMVAEALYMTNTLFISGNNDKPLSDLRLQTGRRDPRGNVFNIPHLYDLQFGDISGLSVPLIQGMPSGRGMRFQAAPLTRTTNFDTTIIEGDAPPGWDAELYIGSRLYSFQPVNNNGRYRFTQIPVGYGSNNIRVVLYGPQGQVREISYQQDISSNNVPVGEFQSYGYLAQANDALLPVVDKADNPFSGEIVGSLRLDYGLTRWLTTGFFAARSPLLKTTFDEQEGNDAFFGPIYSNEPISEASNYYGMELRPVLGAVNFSGGVVKQQAGGLGFYGKTYVPLNYLPFSVEYEHYDEDFTSIQNLRGNSSLRSRLEGRVGIPINRLSPALGYLSLSATQEVQFDQYRHVLANINYSHNVGDLFFNHLFEREQDNYAGQLTADTQNSYRLLASYRRDLFDFRGEVYYRLDNSLGFQYSNFSALWRYYNNDSLNLNLSYTPNSGLGAGLAWNKDLGFSTLSLGVSRSAEGEYSLAAGLNFALAYQPNKGFTISSTSNTYNGAADLLVSQQTAQGQSRPLADIGVLNNDFLHPIKTDQNGRVLLSGLSATSPTLLKLQADSLPDPFLTPMQPAVEIWLRPGQTLPVSMGVIEAKELNGILMQQNSSGSKDPLEHVRLQLLSADGKVYAETSTLSDGYYSFDSAYRGEWQLRLAPQQDIELTPIPSGALAITLRDSPSSATFNLLLAQGSLQQDVEP